MLSIGVVGDSNVGKSTLLNVLLGDSILPSKRTSCTSVLTHCVLDGGARGDEQGVGGELVKPGDCLLSHDGDIYAGSAAVMGKIRSLNTQSRAQGKQMRVPEDDAVGDVAMREALLLEAARDVKLITYTEVGGAYLHVPTFVFQAYLKDHEQAGTCIFGDLTMMTENLQWAIDKYFAGQGVCAEATLLFWDHCTSYLQHSVLIVTCTHVAFRDPFRLWVVRLEQLLELEPYDPSIDWCDCRRIQVSGCDEADFQVLRLGKGVVNTDCRVRAMHPLFELVSTFARGHRIAAALAEQERMQEATGVVDLVVHTGTCEKLRSMGNGQVKLIDMPGRNEVDNPIVKECTDVATSLCHSVMILVKYDNICTEATARMLETLVEEAPHLFDFEHGLGTGLTPVMFVITQVDEFDNCHLDDPGDRDDAISLKEDFLQFLKNRGCFKRFPGLLERAPIFAVGISQRVQAGVPFKYEYDLEDLLATLTAVHHSRLMLLESRKVKLATHICQFFREDLALGADAYPIFASIALGKQWSKVQVVTTTIGVGSLALGGWMAYAACAARGVAVAAVGAGSGQLFTSSAMAGAFGGSAGMVSSVATASAVFASSGAAAAGTAAAAGAPCVLFAAGAIMVGGAASLGGGIAAFVIGGQIVATAAGVGCVGAHAAVKAIELPTSASVAASEKEGGEPYQDILMWRDSSRNVLYVGQFRGKVPNGTGRLFWEDTQTESFVGEFADGRIKEGYFISKRMVVIGRLKHEVPADEKEMRLVVDGLQPEALYDCDPSRPYTRDAAILAQELQG